tara:strand:- start:284 stop:1333 length:1050 start_codon:yes stop_codon:yes gene_type:complete
MAKELLKEAIADAKAVREVALQNAKMALEEAFDSKIKNMLSARLAEELEEDVELEEVYDEDEKSEGMSYEEDSANVSDVSGATEEGVDEEINLDELMAELEEMSYDEDEKSEGMKYDEDDMKKEMKDDDDMKEATLEEADMDAALASAKEKAKKAGKSGAAALKYIADLLTGKEFIDSGISGGRHVREEDDETNESIDIDALISEIESELEEGKKKEDKEDVKKEVKKAKEELKEALKTVVSLKSTISEMNLLNSKLLYCNKLFRANSLTEAQKVKVVDALDLATTANEAKLVFSTLQESFNFTGVEKRGITEGLGRASKASGIAPKKVIAESVDGTISRFQKLANIKF